MATLQECCQTLLSKLTNFRRPLAPLRVEDGTLQVCPPPLRTLRGTNQVAKVNVKVNVINSDGSGGSKISGSDFSDGSGNSGTL